MGVDRVRCGDEALVASPPQQPPPPPPPDLSDRREVCLLRGEGRGGVTMSAR